MDSRRFYPSQRPPNDQPWPKNHTRGSSNMVGGPDVGYSFQPRRQTPYDRPTPKQRPPSLLLSEKPSLPPLPQQITNGLVVIDEYFCDLHLDIDSSGCCGCPKHDGGFEYMWAGCRATHGVSAGRICFECHVQEALPVNMPEMETTPHVLRVGWSVEESSLQLGEDRWSYGYGGTGKVSTNNKFVSYGQAFAAGDVITCYLDLDSTPQAMFYSVNGVYQGVAFTLEQSLMGKSLLPHVTVKNMRFRLNFGASPPSFPLTSGFRMLEHTARDGYARRAHIGPARRENAEVLMLVGLPAAGKTYWVEHFIKDYPDKHYCVLGTNNIIDKMRIMGLSRKRNYHGRWDALIKQATGILNKLLKIAEKRVRNYIIDQTNVYASARQRKMRPFHGYRRIAVVVVNDNQTLITRAKNREEKEGKVVPQSAVMDMKQNFSVPQVGDSFDEVWFVDCEETRARELVMEFNIEGRRLHGQTETKSHEPSKGQSHDLRNNQDPYAEKPIYSESSSWFHEPRLNPDRQQTSGQDRNYGSIPPSNHEPSGPSQVLPRHSQAPYCGAPRNVRPPPPINPGHLPRAHGPSDGPYKGPHQGYQPRGQHTTHFQPYLPQMHPHQRMLNPWSGSGQWRNPPPRLPYPHQIPPRGY